MLYEKYYTINYINDSVGYENVVHAIFVKSGYTVIKTAVQKNVNAKKTEPPEIKKAKTQFINVSTAEDTTPTVDEVPTVDATPTADATLTQLV
ncbi:14451_t:CDS:2 [Rhizophagus irregularis]|nr:14451_t:CDS:2 [Rhizophagus irregularis]